MTGYTVIEKYPDLKGVMLEVGSEIKHHSTTYLYNHSKQKGLKFFTVDCDENVYRNAQSICGDRAFLGKGEEFIEQLNDICFAYMDCFDYHGDEAEDVPGVYHDRYRSYGYTECSGVESIRIHLEIAKKLEERTAKKCLVVFDDTNYKPYQVLGKGAFAVPYLIGHGFKVVEAVEHEHLSLAAYTVLYREK